MLGLVSTVYNVLRGEGGLDYFSMHKPFVLKYTVIFVNREEGGGGWFSFQCIRRSC